MRSSGPCCKQGETRLSLPKSVWLPSDAAQKTGLQSLPGVLYTCRFSRISPSSQRAPSGNLKARARHLLHIKGVRRWGVLDRFRRVERAGRGAVALVEVLGGCMVCFGCLRTLRQVYRLSGTHGVGREIDETKDGV